MNENEMATLEVFLVEPSHTQRIIISQHLQASGIHAVTCVSSGGEMLAQLKSVKPDLIISSMYLPDMTGVDLIHAIRKDSESYDMAFLLISSETNIQYLEPIRQAGAIAILPKPFTQRELDTALCAALDYLHPEKADLEHIDVEDLQVLLVDDSEFSRKYIQRVLNNVGIERITCASDGKQALGMFQEHFFDLIVTDLNMPEMDGLQLVNAIRGDAEQIATVPILMVTSEQNQNRLAAIEKAGVSAVLDKPFEPRSIKRLIMQLLS
ncbi:response regulator [Methylomonas sp. SURF-2]|uniref:Response regulator n=1 Tax=Methylomonas subterranea TaxID=2952225 RepID=A0ABT1TG90_9GAMM|nr:response regulator [Methylomonas sp. SURF-2]MCQ8104266.1 response regulator [Methylomonas sp. SURF-2]